MQALRVIFYDAHCRFCNFWVRQALKRDKKNVLQFAPLKGKTAQTLLIKTPVKQEAEEAVLFYDKGKVSYAAEAIIQICSYLKGGQKYKYALLFLPSFLRNALYKLVARNRFIWWKREKDCLLPGPEIRSRFLD